MICYSWVRQPWKIFKNMTLTKEKKYVIIVHAFLAASFVIEGSDQ